MLEKKEMAEVIVAQSTALACILFCSCFTTQYLLLNYNNQSHTYWVSHFVVFFIIISAAISVFFPSLKIFILFFAGAFSEFFKRLFFYSNKSLYSLSASMFSGAIFFTVIAFCYFSGKTLNAELYIWSYCLAKIIPLFVLMSGTCHSATESSNRMQAGQLQYQAFISKLTYDMLDAFKYGGIFSLITIIYWITNQGYLVLLQNDIPADELVSIRITQNVFGLVTMLVSLYDSIFLRKSIKAKTKDFNKKEYIKFSLFSLAVILGNFLFLYVLSLTFYKSIDVLKYALFLGGAQFLYLLARIPILIIKLKAKLKVIMCIYVFSLFTSAAYLLAFKNENSFFFLVNAILIANFFTFLFSLAYVIVDSKKYE